MQTVKAGGSVAIWSENEENTFLTVLAGTGDLGRAADAIGVSVEAVRMRRRHNPQFSKLCDEAIDFMGMLLLPEAIRRAKDGVTKPMVSGGRIVTKPMQDEDGKFILNPVTGKPVEEIVYVQEYSDSLMQMLLKGLMPGKFRDRVSTDVTVNNDAEAKVDEAAHRIMDRLKELKERNAIGEENRRLLDEAVNRSPIIDLDAQDA